MSMSKAIPYLSFDPNSDSKCVTGPQININFFSADSILKFVKNKLLHNEGFAVATLNLDHVVKLSIHKNFFNAYQVHNAVVADGFPIVWLGRLSGVSLSRTTGSDLTLPVVKLVHEIGAKLAIIGTTQDTLEHASYVLKNKFPGLDIVFIHSPPFGFEPLSETAQDILQKLKQSGANLCLLALGAPKQEIFAAEGRKRIPTMGFVSVGASIDFIAGIQKRAPIWMQKANMEWLWRLAIDPRRLFMRYCRCAIVFPVLLVRSLRKKIQFFTEGHP